MIRYAVTVSHKFKGRWYQGSTYQYRTKPPLKRWFEFREMKSKGIRIRVYDWKLRKEI